MARVQLALNVADLEEAVGFYSKLFDVTPAKRREGYANFVVASPPLKLVLIENAAAAGSLNHFGVEVTDTTEVTAVQARLSSQGLPTVVEDQVDCCHAVQDKVWVHDPDEVPWEVYTVLADSDTSPVAVGAAETCGPCACTDGEIVDRVTAGCC